MRSGRRAFEVFVALVHGSRFFEACDALNSSFGIRHEFTSTHINLF